jgi:hypothetical protein
MADTRLSRTIETCVPAEVKESGTVDCPEIGPFAACQPGVDEANVFSFDALPVLFIGPCQGPGSVDSSIPMDADRIHVVIDPSGRYAEATSLFWIGRLKSNLQLQYWCDFLQEILSVGIFNVRSTMVERFRTA